MQYEMATHRKKLILDMKKPFMYLNEQGQHHGKESKTNSKYVARFPIFQRVFKRQIAKKSSVKKEGRNQSSKGWIDILFSL